MLFTLNDNQCHCFIVNSYKNQERKCCYDGIKPSKVRKTCDERVRNVKHSVGCRAAFVKCCKAAEERRKRERLERRKNSLGRGKENIVLAQLLERVLFWYAFSQIDCTREVN